jgi:hypothetical protein
MKNSKASKGLDTIQTPCSFDLQFRGFVTGLTHTNKSTGKQICNSFTGIPYAYPPVGEYRWRPPRPLDTCHRYGTRADPGRFDHIANACPQLSKDVGVQTEDCLQLNVWVPAGEAPVGGEFYAFVCIRSWRLTACQRLVSVFLYS